MILTAGLVSLLSLLPFGLGVSPSLHIAQHHTSSPQQPFSVPPTPEPLRFELRHEHHVSTSGHVSFADISSFLPAFGHDRIPLHTRTIARPHPALDASLLRNHSLTSALLSSAPPPPSNRSHVLKDDDPWDPAPVLAPDIERRETLLALAKMTNNAYLSPGEVGWYDLGGGWNADYPVGWEPDADGFRGHVFATPDNGTVVLAIKGTSAGWVGGGGPTARKDKINDNLLFSCCCARVDWSWTPVCGCYRGGYKCDSPCLEEALVEESMFYPIGVNLYNNITYLYPDAHIWLTGHSLGGALASLLGSTFGVPVVAFEAPGDKMPAQRLHLPIPTALEHITHVFHTADPIAMGTCNGVLSSCALGGFAMESRCHLGKRVVYDTVSALGWKVDIRTHGIVRVIEEVLNGTWAPADEAGREVPEPREEDEGCDEGECYWWEFGDFPPAVL